MAMPSLARVNRARLSLAKLSLAMLGTARLNLAEVNLTMLRLILCSKVRLKLSQNSAFLAQLKRSLCIRPCFITRQLWFLHRSLKLSRQSKRSCKNTRVSLLNINYPLVLPEEMPNWPKRYPGNVYLLWLKYIMILAKLIKSNKIRPRGTYAPKCLCKI